MFDSPCPSVSAPSRPKIPKTTIHSPHASTQVSLNDMSGRERQILIAGPRFPRVDMMTPLPGLALAFVSLIHGPLRSMRRREWARVPEIFYFDREEEKFACEGGVEILVLCRGVAAVAAAAAAASVSSFVDSFSPVPRN